MYNRTFLFACMSSQTKKHAVFSVEGKKRNGFVFHKELESTC